MKIKLNIWFLVLKQLFFSLVYWKTEHIGNEHTWQKNSDVRPLHQGQGLWLYIFVAQTVKHLPTMRETWVQSLGWEYPLEKEMATHSSALAWKIPWTEEPGRLQSMGSQRVGHDWATSISFFLSFFPVLNQGPDRENQRCCSPPGWPLSNFPPTPSAIRTLGIVAFPFFFAKLTSPTVHLQVSARTQATVADSPATACCEVFEWYLSGLCLLLLICPTYSIRTLCLMLT